MLVLQSFCSDGVCAEDGHGVRATVQTSWQILKIGGGGFLTGLDIACDQGIGRCNNSGTTTKVVRADVYGAYYFNPTMTCGNTPVAGGCWQQIVTTKSMPKASINSDGGKGVYEIVVAPSNTAHFYMMYDGAVFSSTDHGATWIACTSRFRIKADADNSSRSMGPFMAVDPGNESYLLVGTPASGVYYSTDGCSTFARISDIPNSKPNGNGYGNALVAFDQSKAEGNSGSRACATSYGNGIYCANSGLNGAWSQLNSVGMPTTFWHMLIDPSGKLYVVDATNAGYGGRLNLYADGVWSKPGAGTIGMDAISVAVDTNNVNHVYVVSRGNPGNLYGTTTGADGQWFSIGSHSRSAADIPWLAWTAESYMTPGNIMFDPASDNSLWFSEGIGVWQTNPRPGIAKVAWNSVTAAIEELVGQEIFSPPGGEPIYLAQDRPQWRITDPSVYPSTHGCANPQANSIVNGYSGDYATTSPSTIVAMCTGSNPPFPDESGISSDGGSTFRPFGSLPANAVTSRGGCLAATDANHLLWVESNNKGPFLSTDGGSTWRQATGLPTGGWPTLQATIRMCAADRADAGTFYLYNYNANGLWSDGIFKSSDYGISWTRQCLRCAWGRNFQSEHADLNGFFSVILAAMPGRSGELFFTPGHHRGIPHPTEQAFYKSTNAGVRWSTIAGMQDVWAFGFGAAKPGSIYASIYVWGWYNGVLGTWRSTDDANTWQQLDDGHPLGIFDQIISIAGDANTYGKIYECFGGAGCVFGQFD